jgi:hypothetical protein
MGKNLPFHRMADKKGRDDSYKDNVGDARINGIELGVSARPFDWLNLWSKERSYFVEMSLKW